MLKKVLIQGIKFYQKMGSPKKAARCRFYPSCSNYGIEAIERFGAFKGLIITLFRVLRCHPLCKGGYDPVPERKREKTKQQ